ncbi:Cytoplasmic GTPase/eEF2-like protein (ribosomal biogenesis) [Sorochytrium milnesiophthora]
MPAIASQQLAALQQQTQNIRNICILAHVDHGKTTFSDSLLASNGIISGKLAGKLRFLDCREDEQERGITMKSSAISLYFKVLRASDNLEREYLINLIDSPGHVDFSSEVSTASRLCDGALVLVDVVEGVCTQTHSVLHQAWRERIRPILVLNKMDRLITELKMTSLEAYAHVSKILQEVNAVMGTFFQGDLAGEDAVKHEAVQRSRRALQAGELAEGDDDKSEQVEVEDVRDDSDLYFTPENGNVIFGSAVDGWAFRPSHFAQIYAAKLGLKESSLNKLLWGEFYLDPKTKRILQPKHFKLHKYLQGKVLKPLAVQFMFDNVWAVYEACGLGVASEVPDQISKERVDKIIAALKLKINPRELKTKDSRILASVLMSSWLPLSPAALLAAVECLPNPAAAQHLRLPRLLHPQDFTPTLFAVHEDFAPVVHHSWERALYECDASDDAPVVAFVSKMFAVPVDMLPQNKRRQLTAEELRARGRGPLAERLQATSQTGDHGVPLSSLPAANTAEPELAERVTEDAPDKALIGMARLYSGTLRPGSKMFVMGPKYVPGDPSSEEHIAEITVEHLYMLMGNDLEELEEVKAGTIFGIGGANLDQVILKTATLSSIRDVRSLGSLSVHAAPILRVALEPANPVDMNKLERGIRLLNQADPAVEVLIQETGEHVIMTAGELHLERCLKDLREQFAKCDIHVSAPIVPFRETIVHAPPQAQFQADADSTLPQGTVRVTTAGKLCAIQIRALPLPADVVNFLTETGDRLRDVVDTDSEHGQSKAATQYLHDLQLVFDGAENVHRDLRPLWEGVASRIVSFGPRRAGPNILVNAVSGSESDGPLWLHSRAKTPSDRDATDADNSPAALVRLFEGSLVTAFQLSCSAGPLCNEPMSGVAYIIQDFSMASESDSAEDGRSKLSGHSGQVIAAAKDAFRTSFLLWSPRLMLAVYSCEIQCLAEVLGKVYAAVSKRRGRIVSEEMREGTPFFIVNARIPVVESFGFGDDIRKRTSGGASPQLIFSGYEMLDLDPYWVPTSEEELEDLGEKSDKENLAKKYMEAVRKRKGLFVEQKLVEHAEKQRTLMRK